MNATVGPSPTDSTTQRILPPTKSQPITNSSIESTTMTEISHMNATVGPSSTDSTTQRILPPTKSQPITNSSRSATLTGISHKNATLGRSQAESTTQRILPPTKPQPNTTSSRSATMTEISHMNTTVGKSQTESTTQRTLPPTKFQPITNSSRSATLAGISDLNNTVCPRHTVSSNLRIIPPANTKCPIRSAPPIVKVSSSKKTNTIATVGSVKRCKETIHFIFNVMNERNLQTKCNELRHLIVETKEKCLPWLAWYIVTNRINIEPSQHTIYLKFLNSLKNDKLTELITLETETNIKALLSRGELSSVCRKTLINLRSWYVMMTLAKKKPISTTSEDSTTSLIMAYQGGEGKLMYTLPLVTGILETCAYNAVFNTISPWTLDVLYFLNELYCQPDLKFKFQFEMEILFKKLKFELESFLSLGEVSPICRNTLINLGSLYGMMTIAKNKPISTSFEDLKTLLIKAYQGGEDKLMNTLLLVTRILETCAYSTVFNTTSPWTLDILYCLSDLYRQPNLKLKFQFEIEILCKRLKVELEDLKPATSYFINNS
ncbi:CCR4-NOT transcription complex subunit 1, CAF1-binding domain [Cinara cedri]|uniref:CCR4-NOT transcription complex subunit 1, CAF1-binding domain n=1 Tax=Cinara cedri TaxID=506608 RepID=A0A5E4NDD1_9HEMI|nr:CCR4-NOT transcription complex subunit 1, CAF1-binding domain [Cinara cedri]